MKAKIKLKIKVIAYIFLLFSFSIALHAQETWNLKKCIETAKENNIELKLLKLNVDKTEINYNRAKQNIYPDLSANIKTSNYYGFVYEDPINDIYNFGNTYVNRFQLASSFNIFSGFYNRYRKSFRAGQINTANYLFDKKYNEIILEITYHYYQILLAQENAVLIKKRIENLKQRKKFIEANISIGLLPKRNLLNIDFLIAKGETDLLTSENSAQQNTVYLMSLLGLNNKETLNIVNDVDISSTVLKLYDYNTIIEQAKSAFPDLKIGSSEIDNAEFAMKQANSFRYPSLALEGRINIVTWDTLNYFSKNLLRKNYQYIGLNLSIPIYKNYNIRQNIALAAVDVDIAKNKAADLTMELENNVYKAVLEYNNAFNLYHSLQKQYDAVNEEYKYATRLMEIGNMGIFEYTGISERLINAETELLKAKYNLIIKMKVVDFYTGAVTK